MHKVTSRTLCQAQTFPRVGRVGAGLNSPAGARKAWRRRSAACASRPSPETGASPRSACSRALYAAIHKLAAHAISCSTAVNRRPRMSWLRWIAWYRRAADRRSASHPRGILSRMHPFIRISEACRQQALRGPSMIMGQKGSNTVPATHDHGHHRRRIPPGGIPRPAGRAGVGQSCFCWSLSHALLGADAAGAAAFTEVVRKSACY